MTLQSELCRITITIDDTYTVDSADNRYYDSIYNPKHYKHNDFSRTFAIEIDQFYKQQYIALIGSYYSYDTENCAILENRLLTVLQNNAVAQIDITDGKLLLYKQFKCLGCCFGIYRVKNGYIVYGELEVIMLDLQLHKNWGFMGKDIFVSYSRKNCFEILEQSIRLYDFEDNFYEIDFDGNLISDVR